MYQPPGDSPRWRLSMLAEELVEPLRLLRMSLRADEAVVVHAPHGSALRVLANEPLDGSIFAPEEPVRTSKRWTPSPTAVRQLRLTSLMRPVSLDFDSALVLPFTDGYGRGAVILGSAEVVDTESSATIRQFARELGAARGRVFRTRHQDLDRAYRVVARAATSDLSLNRIFDVTLAAARNLLEGDVAYLGLPVDDDDFAFARTLGITTDRFRDLRVGPGEGLGGAARESGAPVRSLNYEKDRRLRAAKREETRIEGITSALAVPIRDKEDVEAILYVASRRPRAYSEEDERVLADFAGAAMLGLERANLEEARRQSVRAQERARLAQSLHDDLVRRLTRIGFAAEELENDTSGDSRSAAASISAGVNECMSLVRDELRSLLRTESAEGHSLADIGEQILGVPSLSAMARSLEFRSGDSGVVFDACYVPADVAESMRKVGQEALFNAENHSKGSLCRVVFDLREDSCVLSIVDDGTGPGFDIDTGTSGHYGIEFIKREVRRVGGDVRFVRGDSGGTEVRATFPIGFDLYRGRA